MQLKGADGNDRYKTWRYSTISRSTPETAPPATQIWRDVQGTDTTQHNRRSKGGNKFRTTKLTTIVGQFKEKFTSQVMIVPQAITKSVTEIGGTASTTALISE